MRFGDGVKLVTEPFGIDQYKIVASARFEKPPGEVWPLLLNWERFVKVGLPGMTSNFEWLSGGPSIVPSKFSFDIAGVTLREEIYEQDVDSTEGSYLLRYRALEPALGVIEYDASLILQMLREGGTGFEAIREVQLEPGTSPEMLAEMVRSETQCLKAYFAA